MPDREAARVPDRGGAAAPAASTPLSALAAVVIDTETTGLDARVARLVEVAAVRVAGETVAPEPLSEQDAFVRLVSPGVPIPAGATAVHGLSDPDLAGAPPPAEVLTALASFIGGSVVVGHSIRYDLEVLRREAARAGADWTEPAALEVRLLARAVAPNLADEGLDALCGWAGIRIHPRHRALGDALATARLWSALVPMLRARGIRTLAEAMTAARAQGRRGGPGGQLAAAEQAGAEAELLRPDLSALERIDSYPYRHRVRDVMAAPPETVPGEATLAEAVARLVGRGVSSVFVTGADGPGILTERDVLRALADGGAGALEQPVSAFRSEILHGVSEDDFVYRAIGRMDRLGVRHLAVRDADGLLAGAVTTRNLLHHRAQAAMILGDSISVAQDERALAACWGQVPRAVQLLCDEGVDPRRAAGVVSAEILLMTKRAAEIAETRMKAAGQGGPPVPYALMVLGSAGRGESLLAADQDNAIVYEAGEPGGPEDRWFEVLGGHVAEILDKAGVPLCTGGVMARNAPWRRSIAGWQAEAEAWVRRQRPEDLLNVDIFFDAVAVHGGAQLADRVLAHARACAAQAPSFWRALEGTLEGWRSPLGLLGFRAGADGRVDLKAGGLLPVFTVARIVAIRTGKPERDTPGRLAAVVAEGTASAEWVETVLAAHATVMGYMLRQQLADIQAGVPPGPRVRIDGMGRAEKTALRGALRWAAEAVEFIRGGML